MKSTYNFEKPKSINDTAIIESKKISEKIENEFKTAFKMYDEGKTSVSIEVDNLLDRNDPNHFIKEKEIFRNNKLVGYIFYSDYTDYVLLIVFMNGIKVLYGIYLLNKKFNKNEYNTYYINVINMFKDELRSLNIFDTDILNESNNAFKRPTNIVQDNTFIEEFLRTYTLAKKSYMSEKVFKSFSKLLMDEGYNDYYEISDNDPTNKYYISDYFFKKSSPETKKHVWINEKLKEGFILYDFFGPLKRDNYTVVEKVKIVPKMTEFIEPVEENINEFEKPKSISDPITPEFKLQKFINEFKKINKYNNLGNIYDDGGLFDIMHDAGYRSYIFADLKIDNHLIVNERRKRQVLISDKIMDKAKLFPNPYNLNIDIYFKPGKSKTNVIILLYDYVNMLIIQCRKKPMTYIYESNYNGSGYSLNMNSGTNIIGNRPPYEYEIIPLNHTLEPKQSTVMNDVYVHTGSKVVGYSIKDDRKIQGTVYRIVKNTDGTVSFVYVLDSKTGTFVKLKPDNITVLKF